MKKKSTPPPGEVYVLATKANSLVKIGWAKDPDRRCSYLQIGSPVELEIVRTYPDPDHVMEFWLHSYFKAERRHGEWFNLRQRLQDIDAAVGEYEINANRAASAVAEAKREAQCERARVARAARHAALTSG